MLNKICNNVYYMPHDNLTDRPILGLVIGENSSLIIDSGNSPKHAYEFINEIKQLNVPEPKYLVITHWHWDHVFGIKEMRLTSIANDKCLKEYKWLKSLGFDDKSLDTYLSEKYFSEFTVNCLKQEIEDRDNFKMENIDIFFSNKLEIDLGGVTCVIDNVGGDHTDDSTIVYIPQAKTMFLGDCIYGRRYNGVYGYTEEKSSRMIKKIKQYNAEHFLVSHEPIFTKEAIEEVWLDIDNKDKINIEK